MEKVVKKLTFQEAEEEEDEKFWMDKSPQEKIQALTRLRLIFHGGKRLEKILKRTLYDR